jgi:hypothetical protein
LLIMILAAATAAITPQQKADPPPCRGGIILVSKTVEPQSTRQKQGLLPQGKADAKGPAILMPACKQDQPRKKDYPMA